MVEFWNDWLNDVVHLLLLRLQLFRVGVCIFLQPSNLLVDHLDMSHMNIGKPYFAKSAVFFNIVQGGDLPPQLLNTPHVLPQVLALLLLVHLDKVAHHPLVEIFTSEMGVPCEKKSVN